MGGEACVADATRDRRLVVAAGEHELPRLPLTIAVPVSWHIGSTPPAAMPRS